MKEYKELAKKIVNAVNKTDNNYDAEDVVYELLTKKKSDLLTVNEEIDSVVKISEIY